MWLSLTSLQLTRVGLATTLMSLPPIFLIPIDHFVFHERITVSDLGGTALAMVGVAMMFMT
jgi:drug/metabolite transporter (DMT)-like permease